MKSNIWNIIPKNFRTKGVGVSLTIFVRALLNFVGLAALLPVLYLILDSESIHSNSLLHSIYKACGFTSDNQFIIATAIIVVLFIVAKSIANLVKNSASHWAYVGSSDYSYIAVGVTYESGLWYCDIAVARENTDNK
jgi:hypothetical protein